MKQHITEKQFEGLNKTGRLNLVRLFNGQMGGFYARGGKKEMDEHQKMWIGGGRGKNYKWFLETLCKYFKIGVMIEFLGESHHIEMFDHKDGWNVKIDLYSVDRLELCDALWEAVKDTLEK